MSAYFSQILILICIYAIVAGSLNLAFGYTGLVNLGHIAFFGLGAYTSAILTVEYQVPFMAAFFAAGAVAGVFGWVITAITSRLKGDYFALAALAFNFLAVAVFLNWISFTHGPLGIAGVPRPQIFGLKILSPEGYAAFAFLVMAAVFLFMRRLTASRYGRVLEAVRDDALGAEALGKNVFRLKCQCLVASTFCAGLAGSLFAHFIQFIDPYSFYLPDLIVALTILIVGGLASLKGSLAGALIIIIIPELLRFLPIPDHVVGPLRQAVYSAILIGILLVRPRGIFGKVDLE
ncbi:MAG: branched-chain amino acid ABC transporter permease [Candidatus Magasanikbacteria bacterium]|nr:branched-chain amino acid ABC transporter permease [Candidatus Magasanikbacteria bacterium]